MELFFFAEAIKAQKSPIHQPPLVFSPSPCSSVYFSFLLPFLLHLPSTNFLVSHLFCWHGFKPVGTASSTVGVGVGLRSITALLMQSFSIQRELWGGYGPWGNHVMHCLHWGYLQQPSLSRPPLHLISPNFFRGRRPIIFFVSDYAPGPARDNNLDLLSVFIIIRQRLMAEEQPVNTR